MSNRDRRPRVTSLADKDSTAAMSGSSRVTQRENGHITEVSATCGSSDAKVTIKYNDVKVVGKGSFGVVYSARLQPSGELIAVKKVLQDRRFKNRELQIMRTLDHCNVVALKYFFYTGKEREDVYLNLVLEYVPETVYRVSRHYSKNRQSVPFFSVRLYVYQLFRALGYIHTMGICHRDIKPQNLLLDPGSGVLKLCDFGSAKQLVAGEPNVSYICSRYYRAPELIFGATNYTSDIDVWSAGCVLAELLLGQPIFPGSSGVDQLVEIIKVLGTPSREQIDEMNPNYTEFKFPNVRAHPWPKVFRPRTPSDAIDLASHVLCYVPRKRLRPLAACAHNFFNELRVPGATYEGGPLPPLFNFKPSELAQCPELRGQLIPDHAAS